MNKTSKIHNRHNKVLHNNTLRNKNKQKRKRTNNKRNITSNNKRTRRYGGRFGFPSFSSFTKPKESNIGFIQKYEPKNIPSEETKPLLHAQFTALKEFINKRICRDKDKCDDFHNPFIKYLIMQVKQAIQKKNITFLNSGNSADKYSIFEKPTLSDKALNSVSRKKQNHRLPPDEDFRNIPTKLSLVTTTDKADNTTSSKAPNTTSSELLSLHQIFLMEKREETDGKERSVVSRINEIIPIGYIIPSGSKNSNRVISTENNISNHVDSFFFVYLVEAEKDAYASYLALDHLIFKQTAEKIKLENDMICLQLKYDIYYSQLVYYSEAINKVYNKINEVFTLEPLSLTVEYVDKANTKIIQELNDYIKKFVKLYKPDGGRQYLDVLEYQGEDEYTGENKKSNWDKYQQKYRISFDHTWHKYDNIFEKIFDLKISPLPSSGGHWSQLNRDNPWKQRVTNGEVDSDDLSNLDTVTLFGVFETLQEIHKKIDELVPEIYEKKLKIKQPNTESNHERIKPPIEIYYNNPKTDKLIEIMKQMDLAQKNGSPSNSTDSTRKDIINYNKQKLTKINGFLDSIEDIIKDNQNEVVSILKGCLTGLKVQHKNIYDTIKNYIETMRTTEQCKIKSKTKVIPPKCLVDFENNISENNKKINIKIYIITSKINNEEYVNSRKMYVAKLLYNDNNNIEIDPIYKMFNELTQLFYEYFYAIEHIEIPNNTTENNNLNRIGNIVRIIRLIIKTTETAINTINSSIFKTLKYYEIYNTFNSYKKFLLDEKQKLVQLYDINTPPNDKNKGELKGILKISVKSEIKTLDTTNDYNEEPKIKLTDITSNNINVFNKRTKDIFYDVEYDYTMQNRVNKELTLDEYCCYFYVDNTRENNYKNITIYKNNIFVISRLYHDSSLTEDKTFGFFYDYTIATDTSDTDKSGTDTSGKVKVSKTKFRYTQRNTIVDTTLSALGIPSASDLYSMVYDTELKTSPMSVESLNILAPDTNQNLSVKGVTGFKGKTIFNRIPIPTKGSDLYSYDLVLLNKNHAKYYLKLEQ
jgi:hypothetical protein